MTCYARSIREIELFQNQDGTIIIRKLLTITPFSAVHVGVTAGEIDLERAKVKTYQYKLLTSQELPIRKLEDEKNLPADSITRENACAKVGEENIKKAESKVRKLFREANAGKLLEKELRNG